MNNKAHLRPKDFDSNGDIIPMACKEGKGDLISREALKEAFADMREGYPIFSDTEMVSTKDIASIIDNAPTVDVYYTNDDISEAIKEGFANGYETAKAKYEIPQGKWEDIGYGLHRCDRCGLEVKIPTNYCSFCGSHKQEGGAE